LGKKKKKKKKTLLQIRLRPTPSTTTRRQPLQKIAQEQQDLDALTRQFEQDLAESEREQEIERQQREKEAEPYIFKREPGVSTVPLGTTGLGTAKQSARVVEVGAGSLGPKEEGIGGSRDEVAALGGGVSEAPEMFEKGTSGGGGGGGGGGAVRVPVMGGGHPVSTVGGGAAPASGAGFSAPGGGRITGAGAGGDIAEEEDTMLSGYNPETDVMAAVVAPGVTGGEEAKTVQEEEWWKGGEEGEEAPGGLKTRGQRRGISRREREEAERIDRGGVFTRDFGGGMGAQAQGEGRVGVPIQRGVKPAPPTRQTTTRVGIRGVPYEQQQLSRREREQGRERYEQPEEEQEDEEEQEEEDTTGTRRPRRPTTDLVKSVVGTAGQSLQRELTEERSKDMLERVHRILKGLHRPRARPAKEALQGLIGMLRDGVERRSSYIQGMRDSNVDIAMMEFKVNYVLR
jgi:hypothetical protein